MPIRILHIVGDSKFGGASLGILRLANFWQSVGWEVKVLATDPEFCREAARRGVPTVALDVIWREIRPWKDLGGLARLTAYLRREQFTLVHTHTTKAGFVGRLAAWMAAVPAVIHTAHGFAFHEASPWWKIAGYVLLERIASWGCDRVVAVSGFHARWGQQLGMAARSKFRTIRNGVPEPATCGSQRREATRAGLGIGPGEIMILTHGRLAPEKGLEDLVRAFQMVASRGRVRFFWAVAGDGPLRETLDQLVEQAGLGDRVRMLGFRKDVPELLDAADMVVFPSWREGLSIALLEAMGAARPIIATAIGSNREATCEGAAAVLVAPGEARPMAEAIEDLACDPARRQLLAERARAEYVNNFSHARMLAEYHQLYVNLLEEKRSAEPFSTLLSSRNR
jgi:glycosyltransferase involved in cell wall biosynthesis